ncbi:hypothetical protein B296_00042712, partial [Ensete ventricosum]
VGLQQRRRLERGNMRTQAVVEGEEGLVRRMSHHCRREGGAERREERGEEGGSPEFSVDSRIPRPPGPLITVRYCGQVEKLA